VTRILRIFLSHTVSGQLWQQSDSGDSTGLNFDTGQGIPAWQLKIEGRILEVSSLVLTYLFDNIRAFQIPNQRAKDRVAPPKFSQLIKHMVVEIERNGIAYPDGNIVEVLYINKFLTVV
jgi:SWI/SNF-related matrix-associated actin-dependent regulator of chromatin subfamily D